MKKKSHRFIAILAFITSFIYIAWRIFFTIPFEYGIVSLVAGIALVIAETMGVIEAFIHYRNSKKIFVPERPDMKDLKEIPDVDVLVATHNESVDLLYKTINACNHFVYPDKSKVHIYICDDTNRDEMKKLAKKMHVNYIGLEGNKHAKAGNLNNALKQTSSKLVAVFDSDMIPRKNFLLETVPYFYMPSMKKNSKGKWVEKSEKELKNIEKIGFIQTPQSFYNSDLFQSNFFAENNIPNEQDYFFKEVNVSRNKNKSPIFAGSNTLISRECLEAVGGIKINTITEDFATGIEIQRKGYACYAIPKALANGLSPIDFTSLIKQRQRWGRGCVNALKNFKFFFYKDLSFGTKLNYLACLSYWWTYFRRFIYILAPILFTVFGVVAVKASLTELLLIWLPSYIIYNRALIVLSGNIRNQHLSNIVDTILFPYLLIPIITETFGIKLKKFYVTEKNALKVKNTNFKYAIPQIMLLIADGIGLYLSLYDMIVNKNYANLILVYWLIVNGYFLLMAIIFMAGRINYRLSERYYVKIDTTIKDGNKIIKCKTNNISESGLAVSLDEPIYIPYNRDVEINTYYDDYSAKFEARLVSVYGKNNSWVYAFNITNMDSNNKDEYYQIVYDREHTHAKIAKSTSTKDMIVALQGYTKKVELSRRALPRIIINRTFDSNVGKIKVLDFNYEYITFEKCNDDNVTLFITNDFSIECNKLDNNLYAIKDWEKVANNKKIKAIYE